MNLSEAQIESLSPNPAAFSAGKKLSSRQQWVSVAANERVIWGAIKGSGKSPYLVQIDTTVIAYKCTCPSRQFPCKHSIGLLLLHAANQSAFEKTEEPEWVTEWISKRAAREQKKEEEETATRTVEEQEKLDKNREKTQLNRLAGVLAGVAELELWLKDLVRIGFLQLPDKPQAEFEKVAARMVDAKAPGLGGWVKAYTRLRYDNQQWQQEAMGITAKLFLLVRALRNYEQQSPLWQQTLRNLAGWSQSTKELLADVEAEVVRDEWLVAGQEVEETDDDITIQRNWLIGFNTNRTALILNFGTKFSVLENNVLPGTVLDADLAYFPSVLPQRAAVKIQRKVTPTAHLIPPAMNSWEDIMAYRAKQLSVNPWANDFVVVLSDARLLKGNNNHWLAVDASNWGVPLVAEYDHQKVMRWVAFSGNSKLPMTLVLRNEQVIPLGILYNQTYKTL